MHLRAHTNARASAAMSSRYDENATGHSTLVGYALDGQFIYGKDEDTVSPLVQCDVQFIHLYGLTLTLNHSCAYILLDEQSCPKRFHTLSLSQTSEALTLSTPSKYFPASTTYTRMCWCGAPKTRSGAPCLVLALPLLYPRFSESF